MKSKGLWDTIECANTHTGSSGVRRGKGAGRVSKETLAKDFTNLKKDMISTP